MRISFGKMAVMALTVTRLASPALGQQIQQTPLAPPEPHAPQLAQSPQAPHLTTQDCVRLPDPVAQTDCLNQVAAGGDYMPTPAPAPGSNMPMEYRLPLGKRAVPPP